VSELSCNKGVIDLLTTVRVIRVHMHCGDLQWCFVLGKNRGLPTEFKYCLLKGIFYITIIGSFRFILTIDITNVIVNGQRKSPHRVDFLNRDYFLTTVIANSRTCS